MSFAAGDGSAHPQLRVPPHETGARSANRGPTSGFAAPRTTRRSDEVTLPHFLGLRPNHPERSAFGAPPNFQRLTQSPVGTIRSPAAMHFSFQQVAPKAG